MTYNYEKMKEVEQMHDGAIADVAWVALRLAQKKLAPPEWAIEQIEKAKGGDVAGAAYTAAIYEGFGSDRLSWLVKQLERGIGNVASAVCCLLEHECVSIEWAVAQIEKAEKSDIANAAFYIACGKPALAEWAIQQIERGIGDVPCAAYLMAAKRLATPEWAIKQIEKHTGKSILFWDRKS